MAEPVSNLSEQQIAEEIKSKFLAVYPKFGEILSASHFSEFFDVLNAEGVNIKADVSVSEFKRRLVQSLTREFNMVWEIQSISQSLTILEILKNRYKGTDCEQWRPHGKSPQDQTLPFRVRMLQKRISYFEKQLAFQKGHLEKVIPEIDDRRKLAEEMASRRERLLLKIQTDTKRLEKLRNEIKEMQYKTADYLTK